MLLFVVVGCCYHRRLRRYLRYTTYLWLFVAVADVVTYHERVHACKFHRVVYFRDAGDGERAAVAAAGGVAAAVLAMDRFPADSRLQVRACNIIRRVSPDCAVL